jgi:hypothetical protein
MTILGYAASEGRKVKGAGAARLGKIATARTILREQAIQHVQDARYGTVNAYPIPILRGVFDEFGDRYAPVG